MTDAKLVSAGLDYLRLTSSSPNAQSRMGGVFEEVRHADEQLGYASEPGGAFGFFGKRTRHALFGEKKEWKLLQISGNAARRGFVLAREGIQASRVDLQLTYRVGEENVEKAVRKAYEQACACDDALRKHLKVNLIESRKRAQTVYIGSRASDIFFRVYDKFEESKKEEYRGCIRFELELKGRASKTLWRELSTGDMTLEKALQMVVHMLKQRGVDVPCEDIQNMDIMLPPKEKTKDESTYAWLHRQVRPVVEKLTQSSNWMMVFNAIFDGALTEWERGRICRSLAIYWGS